MVRVTVDIDDNSLAALKRAIHDGFMLCGSYPEVRVSGRGFHLIWFGMPDFETSLAYRYLLGDDENRLRLDCSPVRKYKQVLFSQKRFISADADFTKKSLTWSRGRRTL